MSEKAADDAYKLWWEASQKFEYFVTGGSAAVIVWAVEPIKGTSTLTPQVWLIGIAVLVLALATASGIFRLRDTVHIRALNWQSVNLEQEKEAIRAAARSGGMETVEAVHRVNRRDSVIKKVKTKLKGAQKSASFYHHARTWLLMAGLALAIAGRFLPFFLKQ